MERQQIWLYSGYNDYINSGYNDGYNDGYIGDNMLIIMVIYINMCWGFLNWGYPSWMVYKGKSHLKLDDKMGYPYFKKPHM